MLRLDVALEVTAVVARVILDPRLTFAIAVAVAASSSPDAKWRRPRGGARRTRLPARLSRANGGGGFPSHFRWLAWTDLNKPLMHRLSLEAPGTYAHTMAMANLCEAACNAIGADGLLARVGAYYHDIGKLRKPQHFVENQPRGKNPHDKLKPSDERIRHPQSRARRGRAGRRSTVSRVKSFRLSHSIMGRCSSPSSWRRLASEMARR